MKTLIANILESALAAAPALAEAAADLSIESTVERTRDPSHGDFASNVAMRLAKAVGMKPRDLAAEVVAGIGESDVIDKIDIAGPGFINFYLSPAAYHAEIEAMLDRGAGYGRQDSRDGPRILLEFVSANPTGPLHVGHGRLAAFGATVGNLLEATGYPVYREYYVNDAGRQMDILGTSVWLRYLELCGESLVFPSNGYKGDYVWDIAATLHREHGDDYRHRADEVFDGVPADEPAGGDKEAHIDALITQAKHLLGDNRYRFVFETGLNVILDDIRDDLGHFGVFYQELSLIHI